MGIYLRRGHRRGDEAAEFALARGEWSVFVTAPASAALLALALAVTAAAVLLRRRAGQPAA
jgi:hypothetical protein